MKPALFPEDEMRGGKPADWRELERRATRHRNVVAGVQAELLNQGWRLRITGAVWTARHLEKGWAIRAVSGEQLLERVRAFVPVAVDQLGFDLERPAPEDEACATTSPAK